MICLLAFLCTLLFPGGLVAFSLEQPSVVVARMGSLAILPCKASTKISYIHWYRHQEHTAPQRILRLKVSGFSVHKDSVLKADKIIAIKDKDVTSDSLLVLKLEKNDEAVYYYSGIGYSWYNKVFGPGTVLRVTDKNPDEDIPPKPTVFLPSITEIKVHNTGTYLCLLEDFFPDVIKIDWKKKDDKTVLQSQQGDTMKTKDTYMKFSWLTVTQESMAKDHKCMVKHERNKGRVDQEIDFPSISRSMCIFGGSDSIQYGLPEAFRDKEEETGGNCEPSKFTTFLTCSKHCGMVKAFPYQETDVLTVAKTLLKMGFPPFVISSDQDSYITGQIIDPLGKPCKHFGIVSVYNFLLILHVPC
ncbi:unnamed protein product [Nyctereutes procyonoides]|uniref:(raccoon dog) hypothetical protein n=1 Tax=Nyctereutes procyonoides TaxID=34880 RepID=A0A811ZEJ5_NYCPR|nr:unnamed protein product [Nyctereutes procyonoides]